MTEYQKVSKKAISTATPTSAERFEKMKQLMKLMQKEKKALIIREIEKKIECHITKSSVTKIYVGYSNLVDEIGYNFPADIWAKIIEEHYEPLGFTCQRESLGMFLTINEAGNNNCILM